MSKQVVNKPAAENDQAAGFFKYSFLFILLAIAIVYGGSIKFGFTSLDDTIFINDFHTLFSDIKNLPSLFSRGVFKETDDFYYRPILMVSFMMDKLVSGKLPYYHVVNILFHILSIFSIYHLLKFLKFSVQSTFAWCLIFAVHPVLLPAVVWIPGRNDSMLTFFVVTSFYFYLKYYSTNKISSYIGFAVFYGLALFTKETAALMPVLFVTYVLVFDVFKRKEFSSTFLYMLLVSVVWFVLRSKVVKPMSSTELNLMFEGLLMNMALPIQYIGKIFLPINLSVFPHVEETSTIYGWLTVCVLIVLGFICRKHFEWKWVVFGLLWFLVFTMPSLLVPKYINSQSFEHRLYLPIIGLIFVFNPLFRQLEVKYKYLLVIGVLVAFTSLNFKQQSHYKSELRFWKQAVHDSPKSAYAHKILSVRYYNANKKELSKDEAKKALSIDSTEKYANYYLGKYYYDNQQWKSAQQYMLKELSYNPDFIDAVFDLARVYYELGDKEKSIQYLEQSTKVAPELVLAKQNLLLMYMETNQREKALKKIERWKKNQETMPEGYAKIVGLEK